MFENFRVFGKLNKPLPPKVPQLKWWTIICYNGTGLAIYDINLIIIL